MRVLSASTTMSASPNLSYDEEHEIADDEEPVVEAPKRQTILEVYETSSEGEVIEEIFEDEAFLGEEILEDEDEGGDDDSLACSSEFLISINHPRLLCLMTTIIRPRAWSFRPVLGMDYETRKLAVTVRGRGNAVKYISANDKAVTVYF